MDIEIQKLQRELQKIGKNVVCFDASLISELEDEIYRLKTYHSDNPNGSDYSCLFCFRELPHHDPFSGSHDANCFGDKMIAAINAAKNTGV